MKLSHFFIITLLVTSKALVALGSDLIYPTGALIFNEDHEKQDILVHALQTVREEFPADRSQFVTPDGHTVCNIKHKDSGLYLSSTEEHLTHTTSPDGDDAHWLIYTDFGSLGLNAANIYLNSFKNIKHQKCMKHNDRASGPDQAALQAYNPVTMDDCSGIGYWVRFYNPDNTRGASRGYYLHTPTLRLTPPIDRFAARSALGWSTRTGAYDKDYVYERQVTPEHRDIDKFDFLFTQSYLSPDAAYGSVTYYLEYDPERSITEHRGRYIKDTWPKTSSKRLKDPLGQFQLANCYNPRQKTTTTALPNPPPIAEHSITTQPSKRTLSSKACYLSPTNTEGRLRVNPDTYRVFVEGNEDTVNVEAAQWQFNYSGNSAEIKLLGSNLCLTQRGRDSLYVTDCYSNLSDGYFLRSNIRYNQLFHIGIYDHKLIISNSQQSPYAGAVRYRGSSDYFYLLRSQKDLFSLLEEYSASTSGLSSDDIARRRALLSITESLARYNFISVECGDPGVAPPTVVPTLAVTTTEEATTKAITTPKVATTEAATTTEETMIDEIMTEEATTDEAATEEAMIDEFMTDEAATEEAMIDEFMTDEATTDEAATEEAMIDEFMTDEAATDEATTDEATTDEATTNEATTNEATTNEAMIDEFMTDEAATEEAMIDEFMTEEATTEEATTEAATTPALTTTKEPTTEAITTPKVVTTESVNQTTSYDDPEDLRATSSAFNGASRTGGNLLPMTVSAFILYISQRISSSMGGI